MEQGINILATFVIVSLSGLLASQAYAENAQPNIVIILTDDMGWNALSIKADLEIPGSGIRFSRAYSPSPVTPPDVHTTSAHRRAPSCGPARFAR
jgi:hypothetical protein